MTRHLLVPVLLFLVSAAHAAPARFKPGEVLVAMDDPSAITIGPAGRVRGGPRVAALLERHGLWRGAALGRRASGARYLRLESDRPDFDPPRAARELQANGAFRAAIPNLLLELAATFPNDPYRPDQWYVDSPSGADVKLPEAWDVGRGNASTLIAILDSGVDLGHPDLSAKIWTNPGEIPGNAVDDDGNGLVDDVKGWDFGNDDADPNPEAFFDASGIDVGFHGTFCAGIAAAATDNGVGISGAGWHCRILPLKVNDSSSQIPASAVAGAFDYAGGEGAHVLNLSLGTSDTTARAFFQALVDDATAAGVLCVAAAGNDNSNEPFYPASCQNVLSVAATDENDQRASFSNHGATVDVAAPGSFMWSSICRNYQVDDFSQFFYAFFFGWDGENPYMYGDGTSFACPLAAGVCGLVRAQMPGLTPRLVMQHVVATGDVVAYDQPIGKKLNAFRALSEPVVAVGEQAPAAAGASLGRAWPNPFSESTTIAFALSAPGAVRLAIYDPSGRLVRVLVEARLPAGRHASRWDGSGPDGRALGSGIYFATLETGDSRAFRKLILTR